MEPARACHSTFQVLLGCFDKVLYKCWDLVVVVVAVVVSHTSEGQEECRLYLSVCEVSVLKKKIHFKKYQS